MIQIALAALAIGIFSSTTKGRREARDRLRRWNAPLAIVTATLWALILLL